ncbi:uncharacterized protein LOC133716190 [Rosa rugosa]|uniref:uncharacterized protein LOC133716190 n=1 Tax=Rosa rugosa TaxID=74645 RepID=UPI002B40C59E|nr:uncharacterized protein LOC133716190 [Rosa rugosa]
MKKDIPFVWDQACQNAFDSIKEYLLKPPVLMAPVKGKPLILYIAALERSLGALLAQNNDEGKENALYYLSRTLVGAEHNYTPIEKVCLALIFAAQKLRHYMLAHNITLIAKADPLRYLMSKPMLSGRLAKWSLFLLEFDIKYVSQKAIKGQALTDFLAAHLVPDCMELPEDLPDEEVFSTEATTWQLYFDGAARKRGARADIVLITPSGGLIPYSFSLMAICSNNVVEYEALIIGLEIALEMKIGSLQVYGDSQLIVSHIPISENDKADALANLAASLTLPDERDIQITIGERRLLLQYLNEWKNLKKYMQSQCSKSRLKDMIEYCQTRKLPSDLRKRVYVRRTTLRFAYLNDTLYRRSLDGILFRYLSKEEAAQALRDTHAGICGAHQAGPKLAAQLKRIGYYWPTMIQDSVNYARACKACQWSEVIPLKVVKAEDVASFIRNNIIYPFGVPAKIVSDNASYFKCKAMVQLCEKYHIQHAFSASYNPTANGQAEAFNKVLCNILKEDGLRK